MPWYIIKQYLTCRLCYTKGSSVKIKNTKSLTVLITGATSGIGKEVAIQYAKFGHKVFAVGRNSTVLNELYDQFAIYPICADITSMTELNHAQIQIKQHIDKIDLLILNAGTCEYVDPNNFSNSLFRRVMETNFFGTVNCLEVFLPLLRKSLKPHLVGVVSMAYYLPLSRAEAYGASKAALNYLFETLAIDLKAHNIDVTVVNPGFVETPLTKRNDFPMPFTVSVVEAAQVIIRGIEKRKPEICFPRRLTIPMKLLSFLPRNLWRRFGLIFRK